MDARSLDELLLSTERRESDNLFHSNTCEQGLASHSGGADPFATAFDTCAKSGDALEQPPRLP